MESEAQVASGTLLHRNPAGFKNKKKILGIYETNRILWDSKICWDLESSQAHQTYGFCRIHVLRDSRTEGSYWIPNSVEPL